MPHTDSCVTYHGDVSRTIEGDATQLRGENWQIVLNIADATEVVAPVFLIHDWSGIVAVSSNGSSSHHDLFSWFSTVQPVRHTVRTGQTGTNVVTVTCAGRNPASFSTEVVLYGVMFR